MGLRIGSSNTKTDVSPPLFLVGVYRWPSQQSRRNSKNVQRVDSVPESIIETMEQCHEHKAVQVFNTDRKDRFHAGSAEIPLFNKRIGLWV
jgi:hypothetical protein